MSCLGVHFALSDEDLSKLLSLDSDEARLSFLQEEIEARYFEPPQAYLAQSDKSWDAMHRALADGLLSYDGGEYPLSHVVLGGEPLYGEEDYIMSLKHATQVVDVAAAIASMTEAEFRVRYEAIDPEAYGFEKSETDFDYTWEWFQDVRALYLKAAAESRHVLFTADQ